MIAAKYQPSVYSFSISLHCKCSKANKCCRRRRRRCCCALPFRLLKSFIAFDQRARTRFLFTFSHRIYICMNRTTTVAFVWPPQKYTQSPIFWLFVAVAVVRRSLLLYIFLWVFRWIFLGYNLCVCTCVCFVFAFKLRICF